MDPIYSDAEAILRQYHETKRRIFRELLKERGKTLTIVIPAKHEYENLVIHLPEIVPYGDQVIIMDATGDEQTRALAEEKGVEFHVQVERGKGSAIREVRQHVTCDITIFIDADGSHCPTEIPDIVTPIVLDEADHVTPSRMKGGSDELFGDLGEFIRLVGQSIITLGINYYFKQEITDSQNGFRGIRTDLLKALDLREKITTIEQEMVIKTLKMGKRLAEVQSHEYRRSSGYSHINVRRVSFRYVYSWLKYLLFYRYRGADG
jgi:hypothetical protein